MTDCTRRDLLIGGTAVLATATLPTVPFGAEGKGKKGGQNMVNDKRGAAPASAPKVDPTGKYTLNGWGQTEADFAFFDLAQDKVCFKSDGWLTKNTADHPNSYK